MYKKDNMERMWEKKKAQPSVPADICKRFSILLLNCYGQAILMSGCFFKEQSSLYLNQAMCMDLCALPYRLLWRRGS